MYAYRKQKEVYVIVSNLYYLPCTKNVTREYFPEIKWKNYLEYRLREFERDMHAYRKQKEMKENLRYS